jgi:uncharacterized protein
MDSSRIKDILSTSRNIAIVGLSAKPDRSSNMVARYLLQQGFNIFPVNPGIAMVLGLPCYPSLLSLPAEVRTNIDIVTIFRKSEDVPPVVDDAIEIGATCIWMQSGITNRDAAVKAENAGLFVVENRCIAVEHQHFFH